MAKEMPWGQFHTRQRQIPPLLSSPRPEDYTDGVPWAGGGTVTAYITLSGDPISIPVSVTLMVSPGQEEAQ